MKTVIKIIPESVKKNPQAGKTITRVYGARDISFEIKGEMPDYLKDEENCVITSWSENPKWCKGLLFNEDLVERLRSEKKFNININIKNNVENIHHSPNPQYLFSYENPLIECDSCHNKVKLSDIKEEYSDDGYAYLLCPKCNNIDTFEIKYERINDVIKKTP